MVDSERTVESGPRTEAAPPPPTHEPAPPHEPPPRRAAGPRWSRRATTTLVVLVAIAIGTTVVSVTLIRTTGAYEQSDRPRADRSHDAVPDRAGPSGAAPGTIPGASLSGVGRDLAALLGVTLDGHAGVVSGRTTDRTLGLDVRVTATAGAQPDSLDALTCAFIGPSMTVDGRVLARAIQCITTAVPAEHRSPISAWLTANGASASTAQPRQHDFGPVALTVTRADDTFAVSLTPVTAATAR